MIGRALGHYQITEKLGEGGMGVVYKARDTHLDRFVAIKTLPPERTVDPERKRRFVQEAKAASALNHPSIITIYDIDHADGIDYIAMEYVPGKTLDELIPRKGMRLSLALKYAVQVADALARAHGAGIIHRDLKPSNVMVDKHGLVKVLDFGLAKLTEVGPVGDDASTRTVEAATEKGTIIGTVAYMSPEQAEGRHIDTRSDIFSFGSMLYEMLTGQRAFRGDTKASTIAAILKEEPKSISQAAEGLPHEVERIVKRCLRKDPEHRFQYMADLRVALEELQEESDSGALEAASATKAKPRYQLVWAFVVAASLVIGAVGIWYARSRTGTQEAPPTIVPLITYPGILGDPTFSPDGNDIAFTWNGEKRDNPDVYRKLIGLGHPLRLTSDPAPDVRPAWSPDGRFIAFLRVWESNRLGVFLVPALGGGEQKIGEIHPVLSSATLAWSPNSRWLVITDRNGAGRPGSSQSRSHGLHLLSVDSGEGRELTVPPLETRFGDELASFSPDGHAIVFVRRLDFSRSEVYRLSLTEEMRPVGEPERLAYEDRRIYGVLWTPDGKDILYSSGAYLAAESFVRRIRISEPKTNSGYRIVQESFGDGARALAISPNGRRLAYGRHLQDSDIYRLELPANDGATKIPEKFIASTRSDSGPEYSPNGQAVAFQSIRTGSSEIWICSADGSNPRQLTSMGGPQTSNPSWSPDGEWIVFDSRKAGSADIYVVSANGGSPRRLTFDPGYEGTARWSRDCKWIYFHSDRTGRREVYKLPLSGGAAVQVTKNGGAGAREAPDGKWIYYSKQVPGNEFSGQTIWKVAAEGGEESQVHPGPLSYLDDFVVLEDGIYLTKTDGFLEFLDFASGKSKTVAQLEATSFSGITISPDRRWVLYRKPQPPASDLMLVENFR